MANIHERFALGQERLANRMTQLIQAMQNHNGEGSSSGIHSVRQPLGSSFGVVARPFKPTFLPREESIPKIETQHSVGHNIATIYEEYRALPDEIRDAMSLAEFIGLKNGRVGIGPRSKPRAIPKENGKHVPALEGKNPSIMIKEEEEHSKLLGMDREQPMEALEVPIILHEGEPLTDFQNSSMKGHVFSEETMGHEPKKEEKSDLQDGEERLMVEAQLPKDKDDDQLARSFRTASNEKQIDDVHDSGKSHDVVPYMYQQNEDASTNSHKAKKDEHYEDNQRYEGNSDLLLSTMPFQICGHGQFVEKDDHGASLMLHSKSRQMGDHHGAKNGEKSELQGVNGAKIPGDLVGRHAHGIRASLDAHVNLQLAGNFMTATY
ncbi:hypothetical protein KI387_042170, partial [Taxus chinensis]